MKRISDRDIRAIIRENKKLKKENEFLLGEIKNVFNENNEIEISNSDSINDIKLSEDQSNLDCDSVLQEFLI